MLNPTTYSLCLMMSVAALVSACGGEFSSSDLAAADPDLLQAQTQCPGGACDPGVVVSDAKKGGAAAVSSTATGAVSKAEMEAKDKACDVAKGSIEAAPCPDPDNCVPDRVETGCAYSDAACPVSGTFGAKPREWVGACQASSEPDAWKARHCSLRGGSGGKPNFAICTVKATATSTTVCKPKTSECSADPQFTTAQLAQGLE